MSDREALLKQDLKLVNITDCCTLTKYNFSNYNACDCYKELKGFDKFFAYIFRFYKPNANLVYAHQKCVEYKNNNVYHGISDPDSNCILLRKIYKCLWDEKILNYCTTEEGEIRGDTMNSVNTTLNVLVKSFTSKRASKLSNADKYYSTNGELKNFLDGNSDLLTFINVYHTIGNFIPFPVDCNSPRGTGKTKDYWDLTLKQIKAYYTYKKNGNEDDAKKSVVDICGEEKTEIFIKWLDEFVDWHFFIEKNYMSAFVGENGEPKELWEGHFTGDILPNAVQCNQFFENANAWIKKRSEEMSRRIFTT